MGTTAIEWADVVWNPVTGCRKVSPGCEHCYAERVFPRAYARAGHWKGQNPSRKFTDVVCHPDRLDQPLRWRKPRRVFVNSMSDLFHEDVPDEFISDVFDVMEKARDHTFLVLTKRPKRMRELLGDFDAIEQSIVHNVHLGVSVEDQQRADERIPVLLDTPAAVRWVSLEPMLGPVDLGAAEGLPVYLEATVVKERAMPSGHLMRERPGRGWCRHDGNLHPWLDWVVVGGESGPKARPMHPDWPRSVRDQCVAAGVPFFFKQWGEWHPWYLDGRAMPVNPERPCITFDDGVVVRRVGKSAAGRDLDGRTWDELP